ncbi:MAG: N-acetylmuramoyl-L-alanine amidase [Candidatus Babeliaceae bacterium]
MKNTTLSFLCISTFFIGIFCYALYQRYIIFIFPAWVSPLSATTPKQPLQKKVLIFYPHIETLKSEYKEMLFADQQEKNITTLINLWLSLLDEEHMLPKKITLQTALLNASGNELFISFDHAPFCKQSAAYEKYLLIESLCKTLRENGVTTPFIRFLVHHQPLKDYHVDFSSPWPLSGFSDALKASNPSPLHKHSLTLMLDPAGDAQTTGRIIGEYFERTLTLEYAQELKKILESQLPHVRVILTRVAGEMIEPLQNAAFANKLRVDLYISLHFFQEKNILSRWYIYSFINNPLADLAGRNNQTLQLIPYNQAHRTYCIHNIQYARCAHQLLEAHQLHNFYILSAPQAFPFKPLIGVAAPTCAFEIGLKTPTDWKLFVQPAADAIKHLINTKLRSPN